MRQRPLVLAHICAVTLLPFPFLLAACTNPAADTVPVDGVAIGSEEEPVHQQMRRRLRPTLGGGPGGGGVLIDVPPPEEARAPLPIKTILVTDRTSSSVSLRWHDRSEVEEGTRLRRREVTGGWQEISSFGPLSGFNDVTDAGLSPDSLYCYQFVAFNEQGESFSPQRCSYTRGVEDRTVFRAQLRLRTGEVSNAGTDDRVTARLNSPSGIFTPSGNVTVMDYGRNDFEPGDVFNYDLELTDLSNLEDVTLLSLSKSGSDGWFVASVSLLINNRLVFATDFAANDEPCLWLDDGVGSSSTLTINHEELRAHDLWQGFVQTFPLGFDRDEIESRIEGMIGNLLAADDRVDWRDGNSGGWVEASRKNDETVHIDLDLEGDQFGPNPSIDIDFDVTFRFVRNGDQFELDIATSNLEADVDFDWFTETLSFILPCGPIASIALDQGIPNCITALEKYIEDEIHRGWQPIARHFLVGALCPEETSPRAQVFDFEGTLTEVSFVCVQDVEPDLF